MTRFELPKWTSIMGRIGGVFFFALVAQIGYLTYAGAQADNAGRSLHLLLFSGRNIYVGDVAFYSFVTLLSVTLVLNLIYGAYLVGAYLDARRTGRG